MADWKHDVMESITPIATTIGNEIAKDPGKALATAGSILVSAGPVLMPVAAAGAAIAAGCWIGKKLADWF